MCGAVISGSRETVLKRNLSHLILKEQARNCLNIWRTGFWSFFNADASIVKAVTMPINSRLKFEHSDVKKWLHFTERTENLYRSFWIDKESCGQFVPGFHSAIGFLAIYTEQSCVYSATLAYQPEIIPVLSKLTSGSRPWNHLINHFKNRLYVCYLLLLCHMI